MYSTAGAGAATLIMMLVYLAIMMALVGAAVLLIVFLVRDITKFDDADFKAVGIERWLVLLLVLCTNWIGLVLYLAMWRPKLVAHQQWRQANPGLTMVPTYVPAPQWTTTVFGVQ